MIKRKTGKATVIFKNYALPCTAALMLLFGASCNQKKMDYDSMQVPVNEEIIKKYKGDKAPPSDKELVDMDLKIKESYDVYKTSIRFTTDRLSECIGKGELKYMDHAYMSFLINRARTNFQTAKTLADKAYGVADSSAMLPNDLIGGPEQEIQEVMDAKFPKEITDLEALLNSKRDLTKYMKQKYNVKVDLINKEFGY